MLFSPARKSCVSGIRKKRGIGGNLNVKKVLLNVIEVSCVDSRPLRQKICLVMKIYFGFRIPGDQI